jgi:hypothetical protein
MTDFRNANRITVEIPRGRDYVENVRVHGRIILKWI